MSSSNHPTAHHVPDLIRDLSPNPRLKTAGQTRSICLKRRALLFGSLALAGCGFEPVYGPSGSASTLAGRIDIAPPADEEGFALVQRLEERLGQPTNPDLSLSADIRLTEESLGFLPDGTISRFNVLGRVDWTLSHATGETALSGSERSFTSYSATSTTVATIFAKRDARRRLMVILADHIVADILNRSGDL